MSTEKLKKLKEELEKSGDGEIMSKLDKAKTPQEVLKVACNYQKRLELREKTGGGDEVKSKEKTMRQSIVDCVNEHKQGLQVPTLSHLLTEGQNGQGPSKQNIEFDPKHIAQQKNFYKQFGSTAATLLNIEKDQLNLESQKLPKDSKDISDKALKNQKAPSVGDIIKLNEIDKKVGDLVSTVRDLESKPQQFAQYAVNQVVGLIQKSLMPEGLSNSNISNKKKGDQQKGEDLERIVKEFPTPFSMKPELKPYK